MKANEIKVGGLYLGKINNRVVTVKVLAIKKREGNMYKKGGTEYSVKNLDTGRETTFASAAKFRSEVSTHVPIKTRKAAPFIEVAPAIQWCSNEEPDCVEGEPGEKCPGCDKQVPFTCDTCLKPIFITEGKLGGSNFHPQCQPKPSGGQHASSQVTERDFPEGEKGSDPTRSSGAASDVADSPKNEFGEKSGAPAATTITPTMAEALLQSTSPTNRSKRSVEPSSATSAVVPTPMAAAPQVSGNAAGAVSPLGSLLNRAMGVGASKSSLPSHLIIRARAGTGKTTTLVEGIKLMMGLGTSMVPSDQQKVVWDEMAKSRGARAIAFCAFNNSIASELSRRVPKGCKAATMHSLGFYAVRKAFRLLPGEGPNGAVQGGRVNNIVAQLLNTDLRMLRREKPQYLTAVKKLVGYCKQNLVEGTPEDCEHFRRHYGIEVPNELRERENYQIVPAVLNRCLEVDRDQCVDQDDMIWLPIMLRLSCFINDVLLVDEAQDLNRMQQAFAKIIGRRLILCGDDRQAIYGFAGADADSLPRMARELGETREGCKVLPLTVTRRCGKAIVEEAKTIVPDFEAFETNPEGSITTARYTSEKTKGGTVEIPYEKTYLPKVKDGDMILCRANAPLVSQCLRFLKMGRRAQIQGRDVGANLIAYIDQIESISLTDLHQKLADKTHADIAKEQAEREPSEDRIQGIQDRYDCLKAFIDVSSSVEDMRHRITQMFTNGRECPKCNKQPQKEEDTFCPTCRVDYVPVSGIRLSSIHKAKGLEAHRVFYIQGFGRPLEKIKTQWERDQEDNLRYVAITRAIDELCYVA